MGWVSPPDPPPAGAASTGPTGAAAGAGGATTTGEGASAGPAESHYAVRINFPFSVWRNRYSRPLWTISNSLAWPSKSSLCTRRGAVLTASMPLFSFASMNTNDNRSHQYCQQEIATVNGQKHGFNRKRPLTLRDRETL